MKTEDLTTVKAFMQHHFRHFNAATVVDAAEGYVTCLNQGHRMLVTMAGAMSTAELGRSLAEMIRQDKIHAICCTAANLEEDIFNLVAHDNYVRIKDWRTLTPKDDEALLKRALNRVTDTCIPEEEAIHKVADPLMDILEACEASGRRLFPYQWFYELLDSGTITHHFQCDVKNSWVMAATMRATGTAQ